MTLEELRSKKCTPLKVREHALPPDRVAQLMRVLPDCEL